MKKLILALVAIAVICLMIAFAISPVAESTNDNMKGIIVDKGWDNGYFIDIDVNGEGYIKFISPEENEQLDIGDEYEL